MIEVKEISKSFGKVQALSKVTFKIEEGHVFGLIGTNGAGKSTFLRIMSGVLRPDGGSILMDGKPIYETVESKKEIFFISDDQFFSRGSSIWEIALFYKTFYPKFDEEKCKMLLEKFGLESSKKVQYLSKGMKKQIMIILGICANTKYLLCDETFDGLDPVMRQAVKVLFVKEMEERGLTPIIASHNLRELEDICEFVGLLHNGGILFSQDVDEMKLNIHKLQCVIKEDEMLTYIKEHIEVIATEKRGSLYTLTVRGNRSEIDDFMNSCNLIFYELIPLSLEEIFISETEVRGYDVRALFC